MHPRVVFLAGKKPKPATILADVIETLESRGVGCRVLLPHEEDVGPADLGDAHLDVHRGLSHKADALLASLAEADKPLCNPWSSTERTRDRAELHRAIGRTGVPAPDGGVVATWTHVIAAAGDRRIVVKAVHGPGRGRSVLTHPLPSEAPFEGPYLVEDLIEHDGTDRKLYVAGDWVAGLLKPSTLIHEHITEGERFEVDQELAHLARSTTRRLGLHLAGVDVVIGQAGPAVVDVNVFPGYRDVAGAVAAVADHLLRHLV